MKKKFETVLFSKNTYNLPCAYITGSHLLMCGDGGDDDGVGPDQGRAIPLPLPGQASGTEFLDS